MKNTYYILIGIFLLFFIGFAYSQYRASSISKTMPAVGDGEYYVQISKIDTGNKTADFKHITYFSGMGAFNSAKYEIQCDKEDIIECVPSLKHGYYIRPSNPESGFSMKLDGAQILLSGKKSASSSLQDLDSEIKLPQYESAFKINVKDNKVISIEEITRYNNSEGFNLPKGYALDSYEVEKETEMPCQIDADCETPGEYLARSNCPYTSICEQNRCIIICPGHN